MEIKDTKAWRKSPSKVSSCARLKINNNHTKINIDKATWKKKILIAKSSHRRLGWLKKKKNKHFQGRWAGVGVALFGPYVARVVATYPEKYILKFCSVLCLNLWETFLIKCQLEVVQQISSSHSVTSSAENRRNEKFICYGRFVNSCCSDTHYTTHTHTHRDTLILH